MPLTAIHRATGRTVESFTATKEQWAAMRADKGGYTMKRTGLPAVLKQNVYGTRWFQSRSGERDPNYKPESKAHDMAKVWMVQALRAAGYRAEVEHYGTDPTGAAWEADVYVENGERRIAIEVQLSKQSLEEYLARTDRYARSGVKVVWLVRDYEHFSIQAVIRKGFQAGQTEGMWSDTLDLPALPLSLHCDDDKPSEDKVFVHVLFTDALKTADPGLSLATFAVGVAAGRLYFRAGRWRWREAL